MCHVVLSALASRSTNFPPPSFSLAIPGTQSTCQRTLPRSHSKLNRRQCSAAASLSPMDASVDALRFRWIGSKSTNQHLQVYVVPYHSNSRGFGRGSLSSREAAPTVRQLDGPCELGIKLKHETKLGPGSKCSWASAQLQEALCC